MARSPEGRAPWRAGALVCALWPALAAAQAGAPAELTVCMAADNAPLSQVQDGQVRGLDRRIASALAEALGRPLRIVPFESEYEKESSLAQEVNALLSAGVCELASGFPLLAQDLGAPARPSARTPDYPGAPRKRERPFVPLGPLLASRAYQGTALGLVQARDAADVKALPELLGPPARRVGVVSGSLAGSLLMGWRQGALRASVVSLGAREQPLAALLSGQVDAVVLPVPQWDAWRQSHSQAAVSAASWRQPLGLNLGFVARDTQAALLRALNQVLVRARDSGDLARWAQAEGVSWLAPSLPEVAAGFSLQGLAAD